MRKPDLILIFMLMALSAALLKFNHAEKGSSVEISVDGKVISQLDLSNEATFTMSTDYGFNLIKIENCAVAVIDADCPDKICVQTGAINSAEEVIACVPHKLLIQIK